MDKKYELKLSYIDSSLWWKRSLKINSEDWRKIRLEILNRDEYKCSFCGIRSSKYMIIDHINGDSTNNSPENLRTNCPMCDTIRHSGLAGIKKTLEVKISNLNQLEIVEKTRNFYIANKKFPSAKEIDPFCKNTKYLPIECAVEENKKVPERMKKYKGFFTKNFSFKFLEYII